MGKLTGYDINGSTQVPRTHSGVSDSENNGECDRIPSLGLENQATQPTVLGSIAQSFAQVRVLTLTPQVLHEPLLQHSSRGMYPMASKSIPPTIFKPGFCDSQTPIAAELTQSFLDFASRNGGINLKQMGVRPGQRWCVEATRWQETLRHEKESGVEVPPVKLECTHESALKTVQLDVLKKYAAVSSA